jgi:hypothetical protein
MKINACMIVKGDEELRQLKRCLESFIDYVDGVYITVTSENNKEIQDLIERLNKAYNDEVVHYSYFEWVKDFSKARNFNFSQAPQDSDYLFWVDVDDIVVHAENLRKIAKKGVDGMKDGILLEYWYGCTFNGEPSFENLVSIDLKQKMRERFLRPGVTKWVNRLHETPTPLNGAKNNYTLHKYNEEDLPLAIMHTSKLEEAQEKAPRNRELLELQLKDERDSGEADPRTLLYLMKIYAESDEIDLLERTIVMGEEYLTKSGWDEERGTALEQMGMACMGLDRPLDAIKYYFDAIREWPHQPMTYIRLATAYYNTNNFRLAYYWLDVGAQIDVEKNPSSFINHEAMKIMSSELVMKLNFREGFKDTKVALEAAKMLYELKPTNETGGMLDVVESAYRLNEACRNADELTRYLYDTSEVQKIVPLLDQLPISISNQPFAQKLRGKFSNPRTWGKNEICIFANFYQDHFEKWSAKSLETGIGGSETAVIELAREWVKKGYKVTVYGDPGADQGVHEGVTYLPWYYFNQKDSFNIFIQWRSWFLCDKLKSKLFLVDLHDIYSGVDLREHEINAIDYLMVKSEYHRSLAPNVPDDKFKIVSNGI